ncbi:TPA: OmpA family protein [Pseudomonas aeruginosa]|uniref:OmpA family protein n=1 Tax=Pseudomonadales TaxID=72274 RepID=UPI00157386D9|nr:MULTISPECIES: OmpA family protein [Pseudomonas]MBI8029068.1 OmpA family protein [Pseudomonas aeruginosa]MCU9194715.1 OmpA family protein [Pseudomonas aeruginosa]NTU01952.1 OmpA family protein [Pseudomonas aeruginosa]NTU08171.1 OmpA family protein [Pseudomonas aeruginosa]UZX34636.1 OmpA family protein [Pseudomonas sp. B111]
MKKLITASLILSILSLAGCAGIGPTDQDGSRNQTLTWGSIGTLAGAAAGALINQDNRGKGALIGAGIGGLAGAGYGAYADRQEAELRKATAGTGIEVQRQGDDIKLVMPGAITFNTGSTELSPAAQFNLDKLAGSFRQYGDNNIEVTGHTDSVGSNASNIELSQKRAISVGKHLIGQGIEKNRIQVYGAGPSQPIASNSSEEGRAQNRRVEIRLKAPIQPVALEQGAK